VLHPGVVVLHPGVFVLQVLVGVLALALVLVLVLVLAWVLDEQDQQGQEQDWHPTLRGTCLNRCKVCPPRQRTSDCRHHGNYTDQNLSH